VRGDEHRRRAVTVRGPLATVAILFALLALAACGGRSSASTSTAARAPARYQPTVRSASCLDWRRETTAERAALLAAMRGFFGGQVDSSSAPGANGPVLDDRHATTLLDGYCRQPFAAAFKLYKIYGRAAAFTAAG
jgi:hypothetical protein